MAFLKEKKSHFWVTRASVSKRGSSRSHWYENIIFILKQMKPLSQERLCTYPRFENEGFYYEPLDLLRRLDRYCVELHYGAVLTLQLLLGNWVEICSQNNPMMQFDTTPTSNGQLHSNTCILFIHQAPVVHRLDNAIHRINRYPEDRYYENQLHYPLDSNLSSG